MTVEPGIRLEVPFAPIPFHAHGSIYLGYELFVWNSSADEISLKGVTITRHGSKKQSVLMTLEGADLTGNIAYFTPEYRRVAEEVLAGGKFACVYLWLELGAGELIPDILQHQVDWEDHSGKLQTSILPEMPIQKRNPLELQPPVRGECWMAGDGPSNLVGHRRTILPVRSQPDIAQRFAVDWVQFGKDGKLYHDDPQENSNWYCHGAQVLAVAEGIVSEVQDGIIENTPHSGKMATEINLQSAPGNYVILDLGNEHFALYAHLIPGSLKVKPGDHVKCGQALAGLGNSGNSTCPHLHFHLGNSKIALGMQGMPYHFEVYEWLDALGDHIDIDDYVERGLPWNPKRKSSLVLERHASILANDVVNL
jgi:murein DD-endopeptidase